MSLSRVGEEPKWFGPHPPGYIYVTDGIVYDDEFNNGIRSVQHFCELAMRSLSQSGELNEETLQECQEALQSRFDHVEMEKLD